MHLSEMNDPSISGWKAIFLRAFGFGVGFALLLVAVVGVWVWHSNRPKPLVPWYTRAITATFDYVTTRGENNRIVFVYTLQNETSEDYRLESYSGAEVAARLSREKSISPIRIENQTVFVPSGERANFSLEIPYSYSGKSVSDVESKEHRADVQAFVKANYTNLDGFVLFDSNRRYQINFPKGW